MDNRVFMDFMDDDFFKEKTFNIQYFINHLGNINQMKAFDVLDRISVLKIDDRKKVLRNEIIKNHLRERLLCESASNQWYYYRKILNIITVEEFLSLYDINFLKGFFANNKYGNISVFFAVLSEKNINKVVDLILNDNEFFIEFLKHCDDFSSFFSEIDYDVFKKVIFKMQENNIETKYNFFRDINEECQYKIIHESGITDNTLVSLLMYFRNKIKNEFFEKDPRALYLYNRFNVNNLAKIGIKFSDNILKKKEFFEMLKRDSFIEFRNNINNIERYNNPIIIEDRLNEYYDELINLYDNESGLFNEYVEILNNPKKYEFTNSYIFSFDIISTISIHLKRDDNGVFYYDNRDKLLDFMKDETSKKLSEIIIDALFSDNIYNVWLNISEMLKYNDLLDVNSRILDNDKISFYKMILDFDKVSNYDKINLYNKFKKRNFSLTFYEDLRKVKDIAYDRIKYDLIKPNMHPEYNDKESTEKYGVQVYDLRDREYTMLVRTQAEFRERDRYRRGCYSIISNENTQVFGENDINSFLYGYNTFENENVLHMFEKDSFSLNYADEPSKYVNRIMTSEQLVKANSSYSEVQLLNFKSGEGKYSWTARKPDFIVVFDNIRDKHIKESTRLNIPIVVIKKNIMNRNDIIDVGFDENLDKYVNELYSEKERRTRR